MIDFVTALFTTALDVGLSDTQAVLVIAAVLCICSAAVFAFFRASKAGKFKDAEFGSESLANKMDKNPEAYGGIAGSPWSAGVAQRSEEIHQKRFR